MDSQTTQDDALETIDEVDPYFPCADTIQPDDGESIARYPSRVVRDAITRQERLWGRDALLEDSGDGQD